MEDKKLVLFKFELNFLTHSRDLILNRDFVNCLGGPDAVADKYEKELFELKKSINNLSDLMLNDYIQIVEKEETNNEMS